mmetsp:Transcript_80523/g.130509  ORF Transcript_80523/g.130509 Transcript_80523/m.130509 type:complete len:252 (-) Transcript_80523:401-1156(-)
MPMTRSRKSSSSVMSLRISCTSTLCVSLRSASIFCHSTLRSSTCPKTTAPLDPAPASCVQSEVQAMLEMEPVSVISREYVQPVRSHRRMLLYRPTPKSSPLGLQATAVTENSRGLLAKRGRPKLSQTLYLRSSPPVMISELTAFQSTLSTVPSCAFHMSCFACGCSGLIITSLPDEKHRELESGDQARLYTDESVCASVERSMPERDQILTTPSSPAVAIAVPSWFHLMAITAPLCASTFFSTLPLRSTSM